MFDTFGISSKSYIIFEKNVCSSTLEMFDSRLLDKKEL